VRTRGRELTNDELGQVRGRGQPIEELVVVGDRERVELHRLQHLGQRRSGCQEEVRENTCGGSLERKLGP
jgi:hypothetical protein